MTKFINIIIAAMLASPAAAAAITVDARKCVEMALESSADMKVAVNSKEQARLQKEVAFTAYLPDFAGSAMGICRTPDQEMMGMTVSMKAMWLAGINVTQPLYAGGKIVAANKMARIGVEAASQQLRMTSAEVSAGAQ
ncbi:MAG: TolC family protein, partial [Muribaculaceae bacterium]|nr:TolC family protein [Muribaculaceae bacterium]